MSKRVTFWDLYRRRRGTKEYGELVGIVLTFLTTLFLYLGSLWEAIVLLPSDRIRDGYYLVLLSPIVVVWFLLNTVLMVAVYTVLCVLIVVALPYTLLFEFPAEFIRKENHKRSNA